MADEDSRYTAWIRTQPCAACTTTFGVQPHHALYGTTYSPEEPRPPKTIEGARKGMGQRSHDHFSVPLCLKCHIPGIHKLGGFFAGWTREQANGWEEQQVGIHRRRYAMQAPSPAVPARAPTATPSRATRATLHPERERVLEQITDWAGARRLKDHEHQLIHDLIDDLRAQPGSEF